jgi:hypothetical protein
VLMSLLEHEYTERQPKTAGAVTLPDAE